MNETIKTLTERRSVRSYNEKQVPDEVLDEILLAGEYAPSGMGRQPVVMVVVRDRETVRQLSRMNAAVMGTDRDPFYGAGTVVVVFADSTAPTYHEDGTLVMGNLLNAAYSMGVSSCWIHRAKECFMTDEGKDFMKKWGLDEKYVGIGNCILGYSDAPQPKAAPRKAGFIIRDGESTEVLDDIS